mmetsp:Transcript_41973/g.96373  ORF Transcript_41973/g.96373 Transcript_41973/m.96373 type:complete len:551 (-) Transcript_41973:40-1692(-)
MIAGASFARLTGEWVPPAWQLPDYSHVSEVAVGPAGHSQLLVFCLSVLTTTYFLVRCAGATIRTLSPDALRAQRAISEARSKLRFAPVVSALFLASEMHAIELLQLGMQPPGWISGCMAVATMGLLLQTIFGLLARLCSHMDEEVATPMPHTDDDVLPSSCTGLGVVVNVFIMSVTYISCMGMCYGITSMRVAIPTHALTPPSVLCTANLTVQYFAVNFLLFLAVIASRSSRRSSWSKLVGVLRLAVNSMFFAPMLCLLFIGARLRALQVDPSTGTPQPWAVIFFYVATYSMLAQTIAIIAIPLCPACDARRGTDLMEGDVELAISGLDPEPSGLIAALLRYVPTLLLGVSVIAVMISSFTIAPVGGVMPPPEVPPALQCVYVLFLEFFVIYLLLWNGSVLLHMMHGRHGVRAGRPGAAVVKTLQALASTVEYCPMLIVLFLAIRLRAQELSHHTGRPQAWAQDAMYICTAAVSIQLFACVVMAAVTRRAPDVDEDGGVYLNVDGKGGYDMLAHAVRIGTSIVLYTCVAAVCVALWTLTPASVGAASTFE